MLVCFFDTHFYELFVSHAAIRRGADSRTAAAAGTTCRFTADENQNKEYCQNSAQNVHVLLPV